VKIVSSFKQVGTWKNPVNSRSSVSTEAPYLKPKSNFMSKKFQLQIPEPCHEDWNKMTPGDKGRFCDSCQKTVHDFTGMSDVQLVAFFKKPSTGSVCGRFYNDQLERDFEISRKRLPWIKYFFQFALPVFLTTMKTHAQGKPVFKENLAVDSVLSSCSKSPEDGYILGNLMPSKYLSGQVIDEQGKGIPYATVFIKGTTNGASCDSVGFFKLSIPSLQKKLTLIASCVGYSEKERQINLKKGNSTQITLSTNSTLNGEVVVIAGITRKGKTTYGYTSTVRTERISYWQKLKDHFVNDSIKLFPNPAKSESEIKIEWRKAPEGEYIVDLYNLQGQLIKSSLARFENEINSFTFQMPAITPGSYLLQMTNKKSGKTRSEKIIIQ
jgi:hypothetical protein